MLPNLSEFGQDVLKLLFMDFPENAAKYFVRCAQNKTARTGRSEEIIEY